MADDRPAYSINKKKTDSASSLAASRKDAAVFCPSALVSNHLFITRELTFADRSGQNPLTTKVCFAQIYCITIYAYTNTGPRTQKRQRRTADPLPGARPPTPWL